MRVLDQYGRTFPGERVHFRQRHMWADTQRITSSLRTIWEGIGEKLSRRIQRAASNHGVETIEIICLPDNIGMKSLAQKFKTHFAFDVCTLTGRLRARRPTPFSLMREAAGDAVDLGVSLFDAGWRAINAAQGTRTRKIAA